MQNVPCDDPKITIWIFLAKAGKKCKAIGGQVEFPTIATTICRAMLKKNLETEKFAK